MGIVTGLVTSQKTEVGGGMPGPPFAANSADNGVSVDTVSGKIVLGNASGLGAAGLAKLLDDREIELGGFIIHLTDTPGQLDIQLASTGITMYDNAAGRTANLFPAELDLNSGNNTIALSALGSPLLNLGDGAGASTILSLQNLEFIDGSGDWLMVNNGGRLEFQENLSGFGKWLVLDAASSVVSMGDLSHLNNGNKLRISSGAGDGYATMGDVDNLNSGTYILLDTDAGQTSIAGIVGGINNKLQLVLGVDNYRIGDVQKVANGTLLTMDDTIQTFQFEGNGGSNILFDMSGLVSVIKVDGVPGFTGTVSPVTSITVVAGIVTAVS